jgi:hypothetical protein
MPNIAWKTWLWVGSKGREQDAGENLKRQVPDGKHDDNRD